MIFIGAIVGWFVGEFVIGGILFAIFGKKDRPDKSEEKTYTWIGRIIGLVVGMMILR